MAAKDENIAVGPSAAQLLANWLHDIVIEIGDTHAVTWTAISQDGSDTGAQQVSNRRVQFILG